MTRVSQAEIDQLMEAYIMGKDSSTIEIPAGFYQMNSQLILYNKTVVDIKGAGMNQTVISFRNPKSGGEGLKIV